MHRELGAQHHGEAILNSLGSDRFVGYSAGSSPESHIRSEAVQLLQRMQLPTDRLRSKSWDEFASDDAPSMDFIITVCDRAAAEPCPVWPGVPVTAHWGIPDLASVDGPERQRIHVYREAFFALQNRIRLFLNLPLASLDRMRLQQRLDEIGQDQAPDTFVAPGKDR